MLGQRAAEDLGTPVPLGLTAAASTRVLLAGGSSDLAQATLDAVTVPTGTPETMQLAGFHALLQSVTAACDGRPGDVAAGLDFATELAERTGEGNAYGLGFGPILVGLYHMGGLLEAGDYGRAAALAEGINPKAHANRSRQAGYWANYGRSLARLRGRHADAVRALRIAETLSPRLIQQDPTHRGVDRNCAAWPIARAYRYD